MSARIESVVAVRTCSVVSPPFAAASFADPSFAGLAVGSGSPNSGRRGAQLAPDASVSTERASSFNAPNNSTKLGSTLPGLDTHRAYMSERKAAFAPLKAVASRSTPGIASPFLSPPDACGRGRCSTLAAP